MQRYFITAESTYEDLRQSLNAQLGYPNAAAKTVFQTALQAPRDSFRRVLLAVDTDLAAYATIDAAIAPLLDSDAMEEIDEATYLAAVASASSGGGGGGVSSWNDLTDRPSSFTPSSHASSHGSAGSDPVTVAISQVTGLQTAIDGKAAASHTHSAATDITGLASIATSGSAGDLGSGTVPFARLPVGQTSTTVAAGNDSRFTDSRTPTDGSVTDAKITSGGLSTSVLNWAAIQPWAANTAYAKGDLVSNAGIAYRRSVAGTSGATFNVANWQQITPSELVGSQITSGTVPIARLGTGTPSASNFLRGDGTFASAGSTSASDLTTGTLAFARLAAKARSAANLYLWSSYR